MTLAWRTLAICFTIATAVATLAQDAKARPEYTAVRAAKAPLVDGDLSDEAWASAPEITGFTQRDPDEGKPATQQTRLKVVYTDEAIYFAAVMEDDGKVTPLLARRDSDLNNGDYIRISIDSQQDRLNGAAFVVNASNVQMDMILYNDIYDDPSWDAVWESATKIGANGWTAEVRVPYSQLRFPEKEVHTWGLNVSRWTARLRESSRLVYSPKSESGFVSRFADLTGITGVRPRRAFEVVPYAVARTDLHSRADNPFVSPSEHRMDGGVDVKYGLTSSLTLTGTINPDFGQVEVDPAVLNLSQFETFFPEKRPFFTEGADVFRFGSGPANSRWGFNMWFPTFFYSRRIGRSPQGSVDADWQDAPGETTILGAAKVTGKVGNGWTVGVLDAVTDREEAWFRNDLAGGPEVGKEVVEPMTNYLVARATKEYGKSSRAGFMFTSVNRSSTEALDGSLRKSAYFGGVDGYTLFKDKAWILEWLGGSTLVQGTEEAIESTQNSSARYYDRPDASHIELDPTRTSLSGWMGRVLFAKQKGKWRPNIQVQALSPGFEVNDVGFLPHTDAISTHAVLHYLNTDQTRYTREISTWVGKFQNWNFDRDLTADGVAGNAFVLFKNYWSAWSWGGISADHFDDRITRGGPAMIYRGHWYAGGGFGSDSRKKFSFSVETERVRDGFDGTNEMYWLSLTYRPTPAIRLSLTPRYNNLHENAQYVTTIDDTGYAPTYGKRYVFATLNQKTLDIGIRTEWTMSSRLSLQLFVQPFVASGDYLGFKYLTRARTDEFTPLHSMQYDAEANSYRGGAGASSLSFGNPNFNFRSVRGSAVVRYEFRPGSAMYVVWNENRADVAPVGDFKMGRDFSALPHAPSQDVFLVKFSYWLPM
ncbi:MAG TPA: DUF5916 domain-containing protein [Thermoanaerobaculia bacterium]|nr:DUF5916 domain-containing protein [Thermoanaerobaculia bacterium]